MYGEGREWDKIVKYEREVDSDVAADYVNSKYSWIISTDSRDRICREILNEMYKEIGDQALYVIEKMKAHRGDHPRNTMIRRYIDKHFANPYPSSILNELLKEA